MTDQTSCVECNGRGHLFDEAAARSDLAAWSGTLKKWIEKKNRGAFSARCERCDGTGRRQETDGTGFRQFVE